MKYAYDVNKFHQWKKQQDTKKQKWIAQNENRIDTLHTVTYPDGTVRIFARSVL